MWTKPPILTDLRTALVAAQRLQKNALEEKVKRATAQIERQLAQLEREAGKR